MGPGGWSCDLKSHHSIMHGWGPLLEEKGLEVLGAGGIQGPKNIFKLIGGRGGLTDRGDLSWEQV